MDLVDMPNTGKPVKLFKNAGELCDYTRRTDKVFPRNEARAGGLLKYLLRLIFGLSRRNHKTKAEPSQA
jgi:hypothetical protein